MPHQVRIESEVELYRVSRSFSSVHLFLGFGCKAQFRNVEEVMHALAPHLTEVQAKCSSGQVDQDSLICCNDLYSPCLPLTPCLPSFPCTMNVAKKLRTLTHAIFLAASFEYQFLAVYGGDKADPLRPDLGMLMLMIQVGSVD